MSPYLSSNDESKKIELNGEVINNSQVQKLLGVHIDYKLKFGTHTLKLYNQLHNILRLFYVLPNSLFTISETMLDYYL